MNRVPMFGLLAVFAAVAVLVASAVAGFRRGAPAVDRPRAGIRGTLAEPPANRPRLQVLNASGRTGLAREATRRLRDRGFDVVEYGNAGTRPDSLSAVIARSTSAGTAARAAADSLGIERMLIQPDTLLLVDATVILGRDWSPPPAEARP